MNSTIVYVTIGVPFSNIPIMQKVSVFVDPNTDTPVTAAKKLRKQVADNIENYGWIKGTNFNPSELYYEVYGSVDNQVPFACSANSRKAKNSDQLSAEEISDYLKKNKVKFRS